MDTIHMEYVQVVRENIRLLLEKCHASYNVRPFDQDLAQECVDDGKQRGYPMDNDRLLRYLPVGVGYAATAAAHISHRPTQVWIAIFTTLITLIDDVPEKELPDIYQFNERFHRRARQMNVFLDVFADLLYRAPGLYLPIASQLLVTSALNFITGNLLEHETRSMKILSVAEQYPAYQRTLSSVSEAYGFLIFPREVPVNHYIQAMPEIRTFLFNANDILSFYKEAKEGESTNQISTLAARTNKSSLDVLTELTATTIDLYKTIVRILEGSPDVCDVFKRFTVGFVDFHASCSRYLMGELNL